MLERLVPSSSIHNKSGQPVTPYQHQLENAQHAYYYLIHSLNPAEKTDLLLKIGRLRELLSHTK